MSSVLNKTSRIITLPVSAIVKGKSVRLGKMKFNPGLNLSINAEHIDLVIQDKACERFFDDGDLVLYDTRPKNLADDVPVTKANSDVINVPDDADSGDTDGEDDEDLTGE